MITGPLHHLHRRRKASLVELRDRDEENHDRPSCGVFERFFGFRRDGYIQGQVVACTTMLRAGSSFSTSGTLFWTTSGANLRTV